MMRFRLFTRVLTLGLASILLATGCQSSQGEFCSSATELRNSLLQFDVDSTLQTLDRDFWNALDSEVEAVIGKADGQLKDALIDAQSSLDSLTERLEAVDYSIVAAATDIETARLFADTSSQFLEIIAEQLSAAIESTC